MRDALMRVAGQLDVEKVGGKSVDLWSAPFTRRRAVYGYVERQNLPGIFRTFDFASPDSTSPQRFMTTVPQQALFFMNSPFAVEQAEALAQLPEIRNAKDEGQRVRRLYLRLFGRLPDADEAMAAYAYLSKGAPQSAVVWQYGYGGFQPGKGTSFTPFPHFADGNYRLGSAFPDPERGYLTLNARGGHPGRDGNHATIRRWIAPEAMTVRIEGTLARGNAQGDGVRARVVSSRKGLVGEWTAQNGTTKTDVATVAVQPGDTLDFLVDPIGNDGFDSYDWAPTVRTADGKRTWSAGTDFGPPPVATPSRLALYAQALMMTNEFLFVD
jgi:hypothetical protein